MKVTIEMQTVNEEAFLTVLQTPEIDRLKDLLRGDESISSLMPEGDPKIDIKRLSKIFKSKEEFCAGIEKALQTRDKKADGLYRSAKNLVLVICHTKLRDSQQKEVDEWVRVNANETKEKRSKVGVAGLSAGTMTNFINYLGTERFKMNYNFLTNFFREIYRKSGALTNSSNKLSEMVEKAKGEKVKEVIVEEEEGTPAIVEGGKGEPGEVVQKEESKPKTKEFPYSEKQMKTLSDEIAKMDARIRGGIKKEELPGFLEQREIKASILRDYHKFLDEKKEEEKAKQ